MPQKKILKLSRVSADSQKFEELVRAYINAEDLIQQEVCAQDIIKFASQKDLTQLEYSYNIGNKFVVNGGYKNIIDIAIERNDDSLLHTFFNLGFDLQGYVIKGYNKKRAI